MFKLNLPAFDAKLKRLNDDVCIWDRLRRKYLVLTPEEWVRQHFINYLIVDKGFPQSLMANEIQINLNSQKKRCDTVVYNKDLSPVVIVEYKAPDVVISQSVFDQIARYNLVLRVDYLIVSNGMEHYCCRVDYEKQNYVYLPEIPIYGDIVNRK